MHFSNVAQLITLVATATAVLAAPNLPRTQGGAKIQARTNHPSGNPPTIDIPPPTGGGGSGSPDSVLDGPGRKGKGGKGCPSRARIQARTN
ncbi:hypothetical protein ACKVV1_007228 [Pyricularia oryzae]